MLKTPTRLYKDPIMDIMSGGKEPINRGEGLIEIFHFASDIMLYGQNGDWKFKVEGISKYGVCDSIEQFIGKFKDLLEKEPRNLAVFFTHIAKDPENAGNGGGWRWHKWGEYVGEGEPTTEYLDDEPEFENGVYTYKVHDIDWRPPTK
jgi:hypothetical protein